LRRVAVAFSIALLLSLVKFAMFLRLIHLDSAVYNFIAGRRMVISRLLSLVRRTGIKGVGN